MIIEKIFKQDPFSLNIDEKNKFFQNHLFELFKHHDKNCLDFKNILRSLRFRHSRKKQIEEYPFLPIRLFKNYNLFSVKKNKILRQLTSSGTTSNNVSKIYLDEINAINQVKALKKIFYDFVGHSRLPMLILDVNLTNSLKSFNAKYAGLMGFSLFGKDIHYALSENYKINFKEINKFLKKYRHQKFLLFGFTYNVWKIFFKNLNKDNVKYNFEHGILIHGGGWKKLEKNKVSENIFKKYLSDNYNLKNIINYYGMIEQTGSIFFQCKYNYFHCSTYSDIIIRDKSFAVQPFKKPGIIQLLSLIPTSYPGNSILTEDKGTLMGIDDCKCGRKGKYFIFNNRVKDAELRGCSDTN